MKLARLLPAAALFATLSASAAPPAADEQAIIAAEHAACDAFRTGDAAALRKLIDKDFTLTNTRALVSTREDEIGEVVSGKVKYEEFRNHDMQVRRYGDTAVVLGITTLKGSSEGKPFALDVRFTDTYVKRDGQWIMVAGQATRLDK